MPIIPACEQTGQEPRVVQDVAFFDTIARAYVKNYVSADVRVTDRYLPPEHFDYDIDPFTAMNGAIEAAEETAIDTVRFRVHVALQALWSATFDREDGHIMRARLIQNYLDHSAED